MGEMFWVFWFLFIFLLPFQMISLVMNLTVASINLVCYQTLIVFHSPCAKCYFGGGGFVCYRTLILFHSSWAKCFWVFGPF